MTRATEHEAFLGRVARTGTWQELGRGTYRVILEAIVEGDWDLAVELLPVTVLEAEELYDIYGVWPAQIGEWAVAAGADELQVAAGRERLMSLIGEPADNWHDAWQRYGELTNEAVRACEEHRADAAIAVMAAHECWRAAHDHAVDDVYGMLDVATQLLGEECLPAVWDHLMGDWYDEHERRLSPASQPWQESARQLALAITDGFHGHLSGVDRLGDLEVIEEADRIGFRFAPCGSGGRVMRDDTTGGAPRTGAPFDFVVTSKPYDWSFGKAGVCGYCVHCCLLNMTQPMDRLGHPERVIEPPTWPEARDGGTCTWWVYRDPALVPEDVYTSLGRTRPSADHEHEHLERDERDEKEQ